MVSLFKKSNEIIVYDIAFFRKLTIMLITVPIEKIKDYLKYTFIRDYGYGTIKLFDDTFFNFYKKILDGQKEKTNIIERSINYNNA